MFDLLDVAREIYVTTELTDPEIIAKEIRDRIPDEYLEAALHEALVAYTRAALVKFRVGLPTKPPPKPNRSRQDRIRAWHVWWEARLRQPYKTASGPKLLGDFTVDDCSFQSRLCRQAAERNLAKADQWDVLATTMRQRGVTTVRELQDAL